MVFSLSMDFFWFDIDVELIWPNVCLLMMDYYHDVIKIMIGYLPI